MKKRILGLIVILALMISSFTVNAATYNWNHPGIDLQDTDTYPYLQYGDDGECVKTLQGYLDVYGYPCATDGMFGSQTKSAVMAFQEDNNLSVDGIVGPDTWYELLY